jgi:dihydrolipoamide dehydrogenase
MENFDVVVIGSGPGGYIAAIRCAQLGMKTAIIEKYATLGGTCLNVGCIPSKALLDSSEQYHNAISNFKDHGIEIDKMKLNLRQMMTRKNDVVKQTTAGIVYLMKKNKITVFTGTGSFIDKNTISISSGETKNSISTKNTIIATGSKPSSLPGITIDKKRIITSTETLALEEIPKHLVIIGGGVIGLELGSVYARLGSKVSVVEFLPSIIANMDETLGKELLKVLKKLGMEFYTSHKVLSVESKGKEVTVTAEIVVAPDSTAVKRGNIVLTGDYCLVAVGRKPFTENLGLENVAVKTDEKGRIEVNENLETSVPGIFAIGDVIKGAMLAHKAEEEGIFVAEKIAGQKPHINYNLIPGVVYTWPEVASVGFTEDQLKKEKRGYRTGSFPFKASARARASMDTDGIVKVLCDNTTDEILGVHIIGPRAADLIGEAVVAMEFRASAEDIGRMSHAHPTYSEAFKEACLDASAKRALNI